jgi:5-methylcytosine-specific restriction protein A
VFEQGRPYKRDQLHREWSGDRRLQQQGGILTPRNQPFIVLVSGATGHRYGYDDEWIDGVFHYFGAGQTGPMEWVRGNRAIRDSGKDLHLFEEKQGALSYWGQLDYAGFRYQDGVPDRRGQKRRAIVFLLTPHDRVVEVEQRVESSQRSDPRWSMSQAELRRRARRSGKARTPREAKRLVYERSADVRIYVLKRADGKCEGCGGEAPFRTKAKPQRPYLEPHHTDRIADEGPDHPARVIALCPNCHRRVHFGADGDQYNRALKRALRKIEGSPS